MQQQLRECEAWRAAAHTVARRCEEDCALGRHARAHALRAHATRAMCTVAHARVRASWRACRCEEDVSDCTDTRKALEADLRLLREKLDQYETNQETEKRHAWW